MSLFQKKGVRICYVVTTEILFLVVFPSAKHASLLWCACCSVFGARTDQYNIDPFLDSAADKEIHSACILFRVSSMDSRFVSNFALIRFF
jgi:hypothetical protein